MVWFKVLFRHFSTKKNVSPSTTGHFPPSLRNPRRNNEVEEEQRANISITRIDSAKSEKKGRRTLRVVGVRNSSLEFVPANAKLRRRRRRRRRSWRGGCPMFRERSTYFSDVETTRELDIDFDEERIKKNAREEKQRGREDEQEEEHNGPFFGKLRR